MRKIGGQFGNGQFSMGQPGGGINADDQCVDDNISDLLWAVDVMRFWTRVVFPIPRNIQGALPAVLLLV